MRRRIAVAVSAILLTVAPDALAGPAGTLDLSYGGGDGEIAVTVPGARLEPVAITTGGYVLARRKTDLDHDAVVIKLTADGALDPLFGGGDGLAELPDDFLALDVPAAFEPFAATAGRPLVVAADGLYVAGSDAGGRAAVVKLHRDGSGPVLGWGAGGTRVLVSDASAAASLAPRPDGRLVVAGTTVVGPGTGLFLAELTSGGALSGPPAIRDPSATTSDLDRVVDLQLQASGAVVVARDVVSTLGDPQAPGPAAVERLTNGTVDATASLGAPVNLARLAPLPGSGLAIVGGAGATVRSLVVDADLAGDGAVRVAAWGIDQLRPAIALAAADGSLALFGRRVDDGARTVSARLKADGAADLRWNPAAATGLATVGAGLGEGRVVDAVGEEHTALALASRLDGLVVARVTLNGAPAAALTATLAGSELTLDASATTDPDGPAALTYAFDVEGDGTVDATGASPTLTRSVAGAGTATVYATDALGRRSELASAPYGAVPQPPPPPVGLTPTFPPTINSVLTPSNVLTAPLVAALIQRVVPGSLAAITLAPPVQVGGLTVDPERPRDGDRVSVTFRVNVRTGGDATVCRIVVAVCATTAGAIAGRDGNVITVRATVTATAPQSLARFRVTNSGGSTVEVPVAFAVAPPQTVPDYDIVGVELSQGVQRETASARPAPPERDAPYDGVTLAGTRGEWGHPESFSGEVPAARIRVWVLAHGIRSDRAPAPELWVSLGRSQATRNGAVVRYGAAPLLSAPATVPVSPETGLSPGARADGALPYVFHWVPDVSVPRIDVRIVNPSECDGCPTANNSLTIRRPRVAISRMRPTNLTRVVMAGAFVPDSAALLRASTPGRLRCLFGPGGNSTAERCEALAERLRDEAPRDGEPYRTNDRFFTDSSGPMTSLAPFVLGATPAGQVIVPPGADAFTIGYYAQLNVLSSGLPVTRASVALTAGCVQDASGCGPGTAVSTPLFGLPAALPTAVVRDGGPYRLSGLARALHLAWGLAPASGRGGAAGAARWAPDEAGYLGGSAIEVHHGGRGFRPIGNSRPTRADCFGEDLRDLTSACRGLPTPTGYNGTWISPRRWDALLVGAQERAEVVNGTTVSSGALLPCPYRALDSRQYPSSVVGTCAPNPALFDPRPVDMSPFTPRAFKQQQDAALAITLRANGTQVTGFAVTPLASSAPAPSDGRVRFRALDAGGAVLAETGAEPRPVDLGGGVTDGDAVASATLPASSRVARVQAVVDGRVVAQLDRGRAPVLSLALRSAKIGASGEVPLTLSATDPDGDALTTTVQASTDGGRTWQPVLTAGEPATVRVSAAALPRSAPRAGRLRVTVADGFDRTVATSGPLTFAGARTTVRLERGTRRLRRGDDVSLTAAITGDTGGTVRWFAGRRRVATGPTLALGRLPAGRHRVRATLGAVTSMPVTVVVRARPPLVLQARRGGGCRVRLATDVPVTVRVGSRRLGRLDGAGRSRVFRTCGRVSLEGALGTASVSARRAVRGDR